LELKIQNNNINKNTPKNAFKHSKPLWKRFVLEVNLKFEFSSYTSLYQWGSTTKLVSTQQVVAKPHWKGHGN
jgi:hypothetical protein